jgi:hypothetical protein
MCESALIRFTLIPRLWTPLQYRGLRKPSEIVTRKIYQRRSANPGRKRRHTFSCKVVWTVRKFTLFASRTDDELCGFVPRYFCIRTFQWSNIIRHNNGTFWEQLAFEMLYCLLCIQWRWEKFWYVWVMFRMVYRSKKSCGTFLRCG